MPSLVRHRHPDVRHRPSRDRFRPFLRPPRPCALRYITPSDPIGTTSYSVASTFAWEYISPRRTRPVRHHPKTCCELVAHLTTFSFHFTPLFGVVEAYLYLSSAGSQPLRQVRHRTAEPRRTCPRQAPSTNIDWRSRAQSSCTPRGFQLVSLILWNCKDREILPRFEMSFRWLGGETLWQ